MRGPWPAQPELHRARGESEESADQREEWIRRAIGKDSECGAGRCPCGRLHEDPTECHVRENAPGDDRQHHAANDRAADRSDFERSPRVRESARPIGQEAPRREYAHTDTRANDGASDE